MKGCEKIMSREEIQVRMDEIEKQIESVEAEIAHLDLEIESCKVKAVKMSKEAERSNHYKALTELKQVLAVVKAEFENAKRFKKNIFFDNVDHLILKQGKKLGELEVNSGNRPGYLSRMKSGKISSDPSIEFAMTAAEEFDVPLELLVSTDLTQMSATEEFIMKFLNKLISDTQADEFSWNRETVAELEKLEIENDMQGYRSVPHPLFTVKENRTDCDYFEYVEYDSLFFRNCGVKLCGNCYNAKLPGTGNSVYIMDCGKGDDRIAWARERFFEIYLVSFDRYGNPSTKKLCNTLEMSPPIIAIVNTLIKSIMSSLNRVHIESGVKDVISAYMNGLDITGNDDEDLPFN